MAPEAAEDLINWIAVSLDGGKPQILDSGSSIPRWITRPWPNCTTAAQARQPHVGLALWGGAGVDPVPDAGVVVTWSSAASKPPFHVRLVRTPLDAGAIARDEEAVIVQFASKLPHRSFGAMMPCAFENPSYAPSSRAAP
jgi:hypothetical protein